MAACGGRPSRLLLAPSCEEVCGSASFPKCHPLIRLRGAAIHGDCLLSLPFLHQIQLEQCIFAGFIGPSVVSRHPSKSPSTCTLQSNIRKGQRRRRDFPALNHQRCQVASHQRARVGKPDANILHRIPPPFFWAARGRSDVRVSLLHPCASRPVPRGCLQGHLAVNNGPLRSHGGVPCPAAFKPPPVTTAWRAWETTGGLRGSVNVQPQWNHGSPPNGRAMPRPSTPLPEPAPSEYCPVKVRSIPFRGDEAFHSIKDLYS